LWLKSNPLKQGKRTREAKVADEADMAAVGFCIFLEAWDSPEKLEGVAGEVDSHRNCFKGQTLAKSIM